MFQIFTMSKIILGLLFECTLPNCNTTWNLWPGDRLQSTSFSSKLANGI